jgi:hypothetical protein
MLRTPPRREVPIAIDMAIEVGLGVPCMVVLLRGRVSWT